MTCADPSTVVDLVIFFGSAAIFAAGIYLGRDVERRRHREREARRRAHRSRVAR